ncbi:MAG: type II secretion system protein [Bacilli bacterium]|nr:type II secretion system protein [Bacilli bacterium]
MSKKGFTLIEVLAVIVILGVIMVIAVPFVTGYIERSKKEAFKDTAIGIMDSANLYYSQNGEGDLGDVNFICTNLGCISNDGIKLEFSGKFDGNGDLKLYNDGSIAFCLYNEKYTVLKNVNEEVVVTDGICDFNEVTKNYGVVPLISKDVYDQMVNNYEEQINSLQQEMENGKNQIVSVLNNLGVSSSASDTFNQLSQKISTISYKNYYYNSYTYTPSTSPSTDQGGSVNVNMAFTPKLVIVQEYSSNGSNYGVFVWSNSEVKSYLGSGIACSVSGNTVTFGIRATTNWEYVRLFVFG